MLTEELWAIYSSRGADAYFADAVSTLEHSLQAAYFAHTSNAPGALGVAALLHDIEPFHREPIALRHFDDRGEIAGVRTPDFAYHHGLIEELRGAGGDGLCRGGNP